VNKELNEEIDCLKKKVNTLENVAEDFLSKINKMFSEPKKPNKRMGKKDT
jgi:chaperonin cofactor prefoldin